SERNPLVAESLRDALRLIEGVSQQTAQRRPQMLTTYYAYLQFADGGEASLRVTGNSRDEVRRRLQALYGNVPRIDLREVKRQRTTTRKHEDKLRAESAHKLRSEIEEGQLPLHSRLRRMRSTWRRRGLID